MAENKVNSLVKYDTPVLVTTKKKDKKKDNNDKVSTMTHSSLVTDRQYISFTSPYPFELLSFFVTPIN